MDLLNGFGLDSSIRRANQCSAAVHLVPKTCRIDQRRVLSYELVADKLSTRGDLSVGTAICRCPRGESALTPALEVTWRS
jgi:hypothetical protein